MKTLKNARIWFVVAFLMTALSAFPQTINDAIAAYNEGVQLLKTDSEGALTAFMKCIEMCNTLGEEGDETRTLAEIQIPVLHYNMAREATRVKNYADAAEKYKKAIEAAEKYSDPKVKAGAEKVLPQLYYVMGNDLRENNELEKALENYNTAVSYDPSYARAYLGKGLIYKEKDDLENMKASLDLAIEHGLNTNDTRSVEAAEQIMQAAYFNNAVKAIGAGNTAQAEEALKVSIEYGNKSVDAYYQLAKIYNSNNNWAEAVKRINQAIELETGDDTEKARLYYELAIAYIGQGNTGAACDAYKKAAFGAYAENARYQIEHVLKCQ